MRKSILTIATMLSMAFAFGQTADTNPTPTQPAGCTEDANFPAVGVPHEYEVAISGTGYDEDGKYNWYVTQNPANLLDEGTIVAESNDYFEVKTADADFSSYHKTDNSTKKKIGLTWKSGALLNSKTQYFLVLKYVEDNGTCNAMNMKVMKIEPLNQFKLDIDPVQDEAGTAFTDPTKASVCVANVDSAKYDPATNKVTYTYGENTLYYKITAKGFVGKWKPQLKVPALSGKGGQKYVSAEWKDKDGAWHSFNIANDGTEQTLTSTDLADIPMPATAGATPTQDYIVRIVIDNEKYETLADQTLNVATDGTYGG